MNNKEGNENNEVLQELLNDITLRIQSSPINFLIGSGCSNPFIKTLGDIEEKLANTKNDDERLQSYKEYLKIIKPNTDLVCEYDLNKDCPSYKKTYNSYCDLFKEINRIIIERKETILGKQINIFTTNIDLLMEKVLEEKSLNYNDGFSGTLEPKFSQANFGRATIQKSLHYNYNSEFPVFNLIKIHGSVNWKKKQDIIYNSPKLDHFNIELLENKDNYEDFQKEYEKLAIINPEKKKLEDTVLDTLYYDLLRIYSAYLEKENAILFIIGFSMADEHIREITRRSLKSNPTLTVYLFCYDKNDYKKKEEFDIQSPNFKLIRPKDISGNEEEEITLGILNKMIFSKINNDKGFQK
ncbi:SIR2 family protein [Candidatus Haliotispira prima]|uniref:SIR2 family protein n=1 Tax=Candidatus Haliotispira prima TaxID=3034016 RepID=A0ABY8MEC5_9SPIO|nr:SIR2 family protein [Candidatus Haliotispira prima]